MRFWRFCSAVRLAACTSGAVTVPDSGVITEVPQAGTASSYGGGDNFTSTIERARSAPVAHRAGAVAPRGAVAGRHRRGARRRPDQPDAVDAGAAEDRRRHRRSASSTRRASQLVVVQPGPLPQRRTGVNIALFAKQTTNAVGESIYPRSAGRGSRASATAAGYRDADAAQRAFLAGGGPSTRPLRRRSGRRRLRLPAGIRRPTARSTDRVARSGAARAGSRRRGPRGSCAGVIGAATGVSAAKRRRRPVAGEAPGQRARRVVQEEGAVGGEDRALRAGRRRRRSSGGPRRSACSMRSIAAARAGREAAARAQAAAKARASARRHSKQGRWPAASAVASSRKKISV